MPKNPAVREALELSYIEIDDINTIICVQGLKVMPKSRGCKLMISR